MAIPQKLIQVQVMLLDNPVVTVKICHTLILPPTETGPLEHDYMETIDTIYSSRLT